MGERKRKHKQGVIAGTEKPFRASPDKPKPVILDAPSKLMERIRRIKKQQGD